MTESRYAIAWLGLCVLSGYEESAGELNRLAIERCESLSAWSKTLA